MNKPAYRVVVQEIKISWSKSSRGGPAAIKRNEVDKALILPLNKATKLNWFLFEHQAFYDEQNEFTHPKEYISSYNSCQMLHLRHLDLVFEEKQMYVTWAHELIGVSLYIPVHKQIFMLQTDEWGQVQYNYREGHNSYEKRIINLGVFTKINEEVFTGSPPTYTFN